MKLFQAASLGSCRLQNRILRSATYEGMCDADGYPMDAYHQLYQTLAKNGIGGIISGFTYISRDGRAMQPGQAGIDHDAKIDAYKKVTDGVHAHGVKIFMQIAHCGRQTTEKAAGGRIYGVSSKKSPYFKTKPSPLSPEKIHLLIEKFANAAQRAQHAGFDGVQLHAAHGYLIHQFILPSINTRKDAFGVDTNYKIGVAFLDQVIDAIRERCGRTYPVLVKISAGVDYHQKFTIEQFIDLIQFLNRKQPDGIEISYGTMDHALNIFRGASVPANRILDYNPRYKSNNFLYRYAWKHIIAPFITRKFKPFKPRYNLTYAALAKKHTHIPIICVGGFRTGQEMHRAIDEQHTDFVSLCRPFICEPDFVSKISSDPGYISKCNNCNQCAIMCDAPFPIKCYQRKGSS
jgi:2,4-dienoyl-CoA reductase-like NADH-dependent reductase (Old Yellow Enzyme family)